MPHFNYRFNHQINYINWYKESKFINIEQEEMREMLIEYKTRKRKLKYKTIRKQWNKDTYFLEKKNNWMYLYTFDGEKYFTFTCNWFDNHKNKHVIEHVGPDAIKALHDRFKRNTGLYWEIYQNNCSFQEGSQPVLFGNYNLVIIAKLVWFHLKDSASYSSYQQLSPNPSLQEAHPGGRKQVKQ